ncbi:MAG TPA: phosphopantothenoylcysteine decarboxylase [Spirochaetota bacterium]|nr:phosphopantothenoylcysteine decarboxylase [Spirochaetota bacterium]HPJ38870.1 phosphopantothenoylcysteine decarboxylase [Spirochaetota bacterium]HPQ54159.1 phosphopantothenoylcysteine decarboxylase [Spirochaetota bacterium]
MPLKDRKVIVTGGPTREWLDPVRFISNPSSGRMGVAIAEEAVNRGAETVFVHGPINSDLVERAEYRCVAIQTTVDLLEAVKKELTQNSVLIMAAAPADYTPVQKSDVKIKKTGDELTIHLKKNPDILKTIAAMKQANFSLKNIFVVGFAAETNDIERYALGKLKEKDLDMICLNDVGQKDAGFSVDTNIITIFTRQGEKMELPLQSKQDVAARILDCVETGLTRMGTSLITE